MKRHLFLVFNHGDELNPLPNVKVDRDGYQKFFQSPEGGYWGINEISIYNNDFNFDVFRENIRFQQKIQKPYDFIVFVFCGHGCMDQSGEYWFEIRPDGTQGSDVSLSQLKNACNGVRTLFIFDACSALYTGPLCEQRLFNSGRIIDSASYALRCRTLYDNLVLLTPQDTFTAGFAASAGETAGENANGGYYSQSILKESKVVIQQLKNETIYSGLQHMSFAYIHERAKDDVIQLSGGRQRPQIDQPRSKAQIPFVVVAK